MKVEFHPHAMDEFVATAVYYSLERDELGRRFRDAVVNAIDRIQQFPDIGRPTARWRQLSVAGFPYDLVYRVTEGNARGPGAGTPSASPWLLEGSRALGVCLGVSDALLLAQPPTTLLPDPTSEPLGKPA